MISKPSSIVKIDFDPSKGLILKWNFRAHLNSYYFRHIIVLDVGRDFDSEKFAKKYLDKIKLGDMINLCCINLQGDCCFERWKQKTPVTELNFKRLKPCLSSIENLLNLFSLIEERYAQFDDPTIVTIFSERRQKEFGQLHQLTKKLIQKNKSFSGNIFAVGQTSLETVSGVNIFNLEDFEVEDSWVFLRHFWSQIALLNVRITIECENGLINAQEKTGWQTVDFSRITRELRMPSTIYSFDVIDFLNFDSAQEVIYQLKIILEYRELGGKQFVANKKVLIQAMNEKVYQRTFGFGEMEFSVELAPGLYSKINPIRSNSLVWFSKNPLAPKGSMI